MIGYGPYRWRWPSEEQDALRAKAEEEMNVAFKELEEELKSKGTSVANEAAARRVLKVTGMGLWARKSWRKGVAGKDFHGFMYEII